MRNPIRRLRHSSWSPFLVPLALPLMLFVPGVKGQTDEAQGARAAQEVQLDDVELTAPDEAPVQFQSSLDPSDLQDTEGEEGRQA
mgnify:CR=1 FL=1